MANVPLLDAAKTTSTTTDPMLEYYNTALSKLSQLGSFTGAGSVQNYYGQAQSLLGGLDTTGFDQLKSSLDQQYSVAQQGLKTEYDNLLANIAQQRTETKQQFGAARGTIMENSFDRNRDMYRALASRGLGSSGLAQLGAVQQRMETGRQVSGAAQQYYGAEKALATASEQGTQAYAQQQASAQAGYQQNLASLASQEIQYKNAYQQQLANLALQLQSTAQSQAAATYSAKQQQLATELGIQGQMAQYLSSKGGEMAKIAIMKDYTTTADRAAAWSTQFGVPLDVATQAVKDYEKQYKASTKTDYFTSLGTMVGRINSKDSYNTVVDEISKAYLEGAVEVDDLVSFVAGNLSKFKDTTYAGLTKGLGVTNAEAQYGAEGAALYFLQANGIITQADYMQRIYKFMK